MVEYDDPSETVCDSCGTPTPRLTPSADVELCDECWRAHERTAAGTEETNDAIYTDAVRRFFEQTEPR